ncbi:MAG: thermonuclease family protein [Nitrosopumilus sp.]
MRRRFIPIVVIVVLVIVGIANSSGLFDNYQSKFSEMTIHCQNDIGDCYLGVISEIVDGDTIHLRNGDSIRFTLVDSPEIDTERGVQSKEYLKSLCPVGTRVFVDEDDGQLQGSYDRVIGIVYCDDDSVSLNQKIIENGHGTIYKRFCDISEFGTEDWAIKHGC